MRPHAALLIQLALLSSTGYAFFPYQPEWLKEIADNGRAALKATAGVGNGVAANHARDDGITFKLKRRTRNSYHPRASRSSPGASLNGSPSGALLSKRTGNHYSVMKAPDTNQPRTSGVDQDGADYSYFIQTHVGSERKEMYMLIDTGAGSSWVNGGDCKSEACLKHTSFGPGDSKTLETDNSRPFTIQYGSGDVKGSLVNDTIQVADMNLRFEFGLASTTSDDFVQYAFDGILGLSMNQGVSKNFMRALSDAHVLDQNIFCVALGRALDGINDGEIKFGSINPAMYTGDINYTPVADGDDWKINLDDMGFDGKKAGVGNILAWIDTGTSYIFGPSKQVKALHALIPGAESSDNTTYTVPCDTKKPLALRFSGIDYNISPRDWVSPKDSSGKCTSNIYGFEAISGSWLVGDTFLKNVYAVFDTDKKRIGFAKRSDADLRPGAASPTGLPVTAASGTPTAIIQSGGPPAASIPPAITIGMAGCLLPLLMSLL